MWPPRPPSAPRHRHDFHEKAVGSDFSAVGDIDEADKRFVVEHAQRVLDAHERRSYRVVERAVGAVGDPVGSVPYRTLDSAVTGALIA